jgi:D-alanyl-D-alanine carboxypeptidase (penicillin-binding protein 5/6)
VRRLESENTLLSIDPRADGIKTGHTARAGYSLVAHAIDRDLGVGLYYSAIGAPSESVRARDAKRILTWGFSQYAHPTIVAVDSIVARLPVRDRHGVAVEAGVAAPLRVAFHRGRPLSARVIAPADVIGPVAAGARVGEIQIRSADKVLRSVPLVAKRAVAGPGVLDRFRSALGALV